MVQYITVAGPHTHSGQSSSTLMYLVLLALTPVALFSVYLYGLPVLQLILVSSATALFCEWLFLKIRGANERSVMDGSALLTAWLLTLSLPPSTPLWMAALGVAFAIAVGKQAYGGLGQNLFNPAMLARVMLIICFPVELTRWQEISPLTWSADGLVASSVWMGVDAVTAATPLANQAYSTFAMATGFHAGSLGESSAFLLLLGGCFLLATRVITYVIPLAVLLGVAVPSFFFHAFAPEQFLSAKVHLLSGATLMVAFFIATDMVTSPASKKGQWVFGLGCGLLMVLIRNFGSFPEGAAFAVLIMNATTPVIDHYIKPAVFGSRTKMEDAV